jgi:hypothetical protein
MSPCHALFLFRLICPGVAFGFAGLGVFLTSGIHDALPYLIIGGIGAASSRPVDALIRIL